MAEADELRALLRQRQAPGADQRAIEVEITRRFGCQRAVMFTDLVGFSRQVEAFGIVHFLQLIEESEALFLPLITQHGGNCLKREGDSMLVLFDTAGAALATARAMVAATVARNRARAADECIEVCIGLGLGEVLLIDGREVWGAEVNAASKLGEDKAKGGEILATGPFRQALPTEHFVEHGLLFGSRPVYRLS
ncbi:adenylate/guanylate cyclase domain-containing protein [Chitinimonas sp.]|uniref:adenylate/guanylate cyclase domain-containing protein n=1 Tax=Chitinimonas sp. TaxID=1934313 RepID=UPI002F930E64